MDQAIWVVFGVIAAFLCLAIIGHLVLDSQENVKSETIRSSLNKMKSQCDFVCKSPVNTRLSIKVDLASGMNLSTDSDGRICSSLKSQIKCVKCICSLRNYSMDLSSSLAKKTFLTHTYSCYFERYTSDVAIECQG